MGLLRRIAGLILLALSALVLALCWDRLPHFWVVHWGAGGQANGWATRTPVGVFMPIVLGAGLWTLLEVMASLVERFGRIPEVNRATATLVRTIGLGLASLLAALALILPLAQPQRPQTLVIVALAVIALSVGQGLVRFSRQVWHLKRKGVAGLEHWTGLTYKNPDDERLWVPKISGLGYTLNFAKPVAWLILAVLLSPAVAALLLAFRAISAR